MTIGAINILTTLLKGYVTVTEVYYYKNCLKIFSKICNLVVQREVHFISLIRF